MNLLKQAPGVNLFFCIFAFLGPEFTVLYWLFYLLKMYPVFECSMLIPFMSITMVHQLTSIFLLGSFCSNKYVVVGFLKVCLFDLVFIYHSF